MKHLIDIATKAGWIRQDHPQGLTPPSWYNPGHPACAKNRYLSGLRMLEVLNLIHQPYILFYDAETTGVPTDYKDATHPNTPMLVELGAILTDRNGEELKRYQALVKPEGWTISEEVSQVHGITHEKAMAEGLPLWRVVWEFERMLQQASFCVCHNQQFDRLILKGAYHSLGLPHKLGDVRKFCTMMASIKTARVPYANGRGGFKFPKLEESYAHYFGHKPEEGEAHGALADTESCKGIFFKMIELGETSVAKIMGEVPEEAPAA